MQKFRDTNDPNKIAQANAEAAATALEKLIALYTPLRTAQQAYADDMKNIAGLQASGHLTNPTEIAAAQAAAKARLDAASGTPTSSGNGMSQADQARAAADAIDKLAGKYVIARAAATAYEDAKRDIEALEKAEIYSTDEASVARERATKTYESLIAGSKGVTAANGQELFARRQLAVQSLQFFTSIQAGIPVMTAFIQQGHQVVDVAVATGTGWGGVTRALKAGFEALMSPMGLFIAGTVLVVGTLTAMAIGAEHALQRMIDLQNHLRATHTDNVAMAKEISDVAKQIAGTTNISTADARAATEEIGKASQFHGTSDQLKALVMAANDAAIALGVKLPDEAKVFVQAMEDPAKAVQEMADKHLPGFSQKLADAALHMQEAGNKSGAFDIYLRGMRDTFQGTTEKLTPLNQALLDLQKAFYAPADGAKSLSESIGVLVLNGLTALVKMITEIVNKATAAWELAQKIKRLDIGPDRVPLAPELRDEPPSTANRPGADSTEAVDGRGIGGFIGDMFKHTWDAWIINSPLRTSPLMNPNRLPDTVQKEIPADIQPLLIQAAQLAHVDPRAGAQLYRQEAIRNPDGSFQTSAAGAMGPLQLEPGTFDDMKKKYNIQGSISDNFANILAGLYYYREQLTAFGDPTKAAGAFHSGPGGLIGALNNDGKQRPALTQYMRDFQRGYHGTPSGWQAGFAMPGSLDLGGQPLLNGQQTGPGLGDITAPPTPAGGGTAAGSAGYVDQAGVDSARKMVNDMGIVADQKDKLQRQMADMQKNIDVAFTNKDWESVERLSLGYAKLAGDLYRTRDAQEAVTYAQKMALETMRPLTEGDRQMVQLLQQQREGDRDHPESALTPAQKQEQIDLLLSQQSAGFYKTRYENNLPINLQRELATAASPADVVRINAEQQGTIAAGAHFSERDSPVQFRAAQLSFTQQAKDNTTSAQDAQLHQQTFANDNQARFIDAETAAIGMNDRARTLGLAHLQAELAIRLQMPTASQAQVDAYLKGVDAMNAKQYDFHTAEQAFQELANTVEQAMSTVTNAMADAFSGQKVNWVSVVQQMIHQIIAEFMKLAILNPMMNELFGENRPTLFGGNGGGQDGGQGGGGQGGQGGGGLIGAAGSMVGKILNPTSTGGGDGSGSGGSGGSGSGGSGGSGGGGNPGLLGNMINSIGGQNFYQNGGLIGSLFSKGAGDTGLANGVSTMASTAGDTVPAAAADSFATASASSSGGWWSSLMSMFSSSGTAAAAAMHTGGVVGMDGASRSVAASVFANAPRYHTGLGNDEFATILQRGERVLTTSQNNRLQNVLGAVANNNNQSSNASSQSGGVVFNISTPNADSFRASQPQLQARANASLNRNSMRNATG